MIYAVYPWVGYFFDVLGTASVDYSSGFENAVQLNQDVRDRCTEGIRAGATNLSSLEDREGVYVTGPLR